MMSDQQQKLPSPHLQQLNHKSALGGVDTPPKSGGQPDSSPKGVPSLSLPKGGGAIKSIGEKFQVNAANGTGSMNIPISISPGRGGAQPHLLLFYNSGNG